jgi:V/A-type H+/Na+-transporting ATPase subunit I
MIEKMLKIRIAVRSHDRERTLEVLRSLEILHLKPVDPGAAIVDAEIQKDLVNGTNALSIISGVAAAGAELDVSPAEAVEQILKVSGDIKDLRSRINTIKIQLKEQEIWGDLETRKIEELCSSGLQVRFYKVPRKLVDQIEADLVEVLGEIGGKSLVGVVTKEGEPELPGGSEDLAFPNRDNPALREELSNVEAGLEQREVQLAQLAICRDKVEKYNSKLQEEADFSQALKSGYNHDSLFALEGWVPEGKRGMIDPALEESGIDGAVQTLEPGVDEQPPTLIRYPRWMKPIKGLFDILGTHPGYFEIDLSGFFMLALPLFAAILIGDAGYGFILLMLGLCFYRKLAPVAGKPKIQLLIVIGASTLVYGILAANYFGITPDSIAYAGGYLKNTAGAQVSDIQALKAGNDAWALIGRLMIALAPLWDVDPGKTQEMLFKLSFIIGCVHLVLAHLCQGLVLLPDLRSVAELGWSIFIVSMFGVIWWLFYGVDDLPVTMDIVGYGLMIGAALIVLFRVPTRNPLKRVLFGFFSSLLDWLATFSDLMSYIRLAAVGLASYYIAVASNQLAMEAAGAAWILGVLIAVIGHGLNIALAVIAIFAHGVRLNMLEFSNNVGVQWGGYAYTPFAEAKLKEN